MNYQDRAFLPSLFPSNSTGAEIGVWDGVFALEVMRSNPTRKLYLIDPFLHIEEFPQSAYGNKNIAQKDMDQKFAALKKKFKLEIKNGVICLIRKTSTDALNDIEDNSLDWVYIDGNHSYDYVLNDLKGYYNKVKKGGMITGDDYGAIGWWDKGVTRAVDDFLALAKYKTNLFMIKNKQFVIKKL